jgi:hypothetical protein
LTVGVCGRARRCTCFTPHMLYGGAYIRYMEERISVINGGAYIRHDDEPSPSWQGTEVYLHALDRWPWLLHKVAIYRKVSIYRSVSAKGA